MDISVHDVREIKVVALRGELTWNSASETQQQILDHAQPGVKLILDLSGVPYMSSAGLRVLLVVYRAVSAREGSVLLVGLSDDLRDTMELTGFLEFFDYCDTLESGIDKLTT